MRNHRIIATIILVLFVTPFFSNCTSSQISQNAGYATPIKAENTLTSFPSPTVTWTPQPSSTVTPQSPSLWIPPYLPAGFVKSLKLPNNLQLAEGSNQANLRLDISPVAPISTWVYALVAPFPTIPDKVSWFDLHSLWNGQLSDQSPVRELLVNENTRDVLEKLWGTSSSRTIRVVSADNLLDQAWKTRSSWAIIPFEDLQPRWKVIAIEGNSPIHKDFSPEGYPLSVPISLLGDQDLANLLLSHQQQESSSALAPKSNLDAGLLTTVILTGVTALVRATAGLMQLKGITYPGEDIRDWLSEADITHISNEIPFTPKCPPPYPRQDVLVFCSQPKYIGLLEDIGTDVVELSGDHFQDWGPDAMLYTIDLYKKLGWKYYGGGVNLEDGRKPAIFEHNGNRLAFLGCNAKPPGYAGATATSPGAVHCNFDVLVTEIRNLLSAGYLPIVTFQHLEYYDYKASPFLIPDFRKVAEAGAVIVSGSQAHQPQAMEFDGNSFLHYGLGNLFFDQYNEGLPERQAFIDRHIFYNGSYISTEILTIQFIDLARPRPMTAEERRQLLDIIFKASGW